MSESFAVDLLNYPGIDCLTQKIGAVIKRFYGHMIAVVFSKRGKFHYPLLICLLLKSETQCHCPSNNLAMARIIWKRQFVDGIEKSYKSKGQLKLC